MGMMCFFFLFFVTGAGDGFAVGNGLMWSVGIDDMDVLSLMGVLRLAVCVLLEE